MYLQESPVLQFIPLATVVFFNIFDIFRHTLLDLARPTVNMGVLDDMATLLQRCVQTDLMIHC